MTSKKQLRAVVITFYGTEPSKDVIGQVAAHMSRCVSTGENVNIHVYDEKDIDLALTGRENQVHKSDNTSNAAIENAIVLIGTRYAEFLQTKNVKEFASEITLDVCKGSLTDSDEELRKAVTVLCENITTVRSFIPYKDIRARYGITEQALNVITDIRQYC